MMAGNGAPARERIDIGGKWRVYLDPEDIGKTERWYASLPADGRQSVRLPGCLQAQGIGYPVSIDTQWTGSQFDTSFYTSDRYREYRDADAFRFPYWLQPDRRYVGPAWYAREIVIPEEWGDRRLTLLFERPHWRTDVWVDGTPLGGNDSLSVPHEYALTGAEPGSHLLVVRVDNRMIIDVGRNAHGVSDHTQGNWNGIVGRMELIAASPIYIRNVTAYGNAERRSLLLEVETANAGMESAIAELEVHAGGPRAEKASTNGQPRPVSGPGGTLERFAIGREGTTLYREIHLAPEFPLWDEFTPSLVDVELRLSATVGARLFRDGVSIRTGIRTVTTEMDAIMVNRRRVFLRGTLECCVFPNTGFPPTDTASWRRLFDRAREFGLNHIRFHSWCPPEAAFAAADEEGFYLQVECPIWANQGSAIGAGGTVDQWLYAETERILRSYGNHPSFLMLASGNEPAGRIEEFLGLWVSYWRARDGRRLYTAAAGWPAVPENDYHVVPAPRIQAWGEGVASRINARRPETQTDYREICAKLGRPVVSHEIGQWCAFPNFAETAKYKGYLKPKNFEIFRDFLENNGMADQADDFLRSSGRLQLLCYKEEIESALRTPNQAGFQLLGLTDFPGQGTALVGVLDVFWDEKGYCTAEEFREFCSPTVALVRLPKRYYRKGETLRATLEVAHRGRAPLGAIEARWSLAAADPRRPEAKDGVIASGRIGGTVDMGLTRLGTIEVDLRPATPPTRCELRVELAEARTRNRWALWVFPDDLPDLPETAVEAVYKARRLDEQVEAVLREGGTVLLEPDPKTVLSDVEIGFSPVFWNTAWTQGQPPHTLGIVCDPASPVFRHFPTGSHADWQWWELIHGSAAMVLDGFPRSFRPIVQPIDTWFRSHKLGLLFEARVGPGRIVVSSMDLTRDLDRRIVARQFRYSLLNYMTGESFRPSWEISFDQLAGIFDGGA